MLYTAYQWQSDLLSPLRLAAQQLAASMWLRRTEKSALRALSAANEVLSRMRLTHTRPAYGIEGVGEAAVLSLPFGTLLHLRKNASGDEAGGPAPPRVLLVAPLSGHFSTLLRETARTLLQHHEVYITDWHNARDVPLWQGSFGLDEYVAYMIEFIETVGPGSHVVSV
ncbi:MAG: polyhydroxyalkanoate depolymerase, partial [Burkholderiaceae bacterium]